MTLTPHVHYVFPLSRHSSATIEHLIDLDEPRVSIRAPSLTFAAAGFFSAKWVSCVETLCPMQKWSAFEPVFLCFTPIIRLVKLLVSTTDYHWSSCYYTSSHKLSAYIVEWISVQIQTRYLVQYHRSLRGKTWPDCVCSVGVQVDEWTWSGKPKGLTQNIKALHLDAHYRRCAQNRKKHIALSFTENVSNAAVN